MGKIGTGLLIVVSVGRNVTSEVSRFEIDLSNFSGLWGVRVVPNCLLAGSGVVRTEQ